MKEKIVVSLSGDSNNSEKITCNVLTSLFSHIHKVRWYGLEAHSIEWYELSCQL